MRTAVEQAQFLARTCAIELARLSGEADVTAFLERKQAALATRYPGASLAMVPVGRTCPAAEAPAVASPLRPRARSRRAMAAPRTAATDARVGRLRRLCRAWWPTTSPAATRAAPRRPDATGRFARPCFADGAAPRFAVVLDLPVERVTAARMREETGIELRDISAHRSAAAAGARRRAAGGAARAAIGAAARLQPSWVALLDFSDWATGRTGQATLSIVMSIGEIYDRLSPARLGAA